MSRSPGRRQGKDIHGSSGDTMVRQKVILLLVLGCVGGRAAAQDAGSTARPGPTREALRAGISPLAVGDQAGMVVDPADMPGRSPVIAAVASAVVPGLGSFYAGHPRHGATHLVIHVLVGSYVFSNATSCAFSWGGDTQCPNDDALGVATVAWLANWGWSVVSAIRDAQAFNARR